MKLIKSGFICFATILLVTCCVYGSNLIYNFSNEGKAYQVTRNDKLKEYNWLVFTNNKWHVSRLVFNKKKAFITTADGNKGLIYENEDGVAIEDAKGATVYAAKDSIVYNMWRATFNDNKKRMKFK